ncbi:TPA: 50S ribosomal protein L15 [Candidatus Acetothermia bacterium]|nr:50S ribosomal protein L15 [Candidatus Bipolaricaulota bacterium]HAF70249.1 50S ribosomal protein L15 [Candidatus Acetothermia bacterium]
MLRLSDLSPTPGSVRRRKRVGRGYGSGHGGHESGRGTKGQGARAGVKVRPGFEGGQTPFWMRFPKRGFKNPCRVEYAVVNVGELGAHFEPGDVVTLEALMARGIVKDPKAGLKVLGEGELTKALTVKAKRFSRSAREKILAAGGKVEEV